MEILVCHASKHGATAEIAGHIAKCLQEQGIGAECKPVGEVKDISEYHGIILGSAVYFGQWRKEAMKFLKLHQQKLIRKHVWLFSSGPTGIGDPAKLLEGWKLPKSILPMVEKIRPIDTMIFHGTINKRSLNIIEKWVINKVKSPVGDFRQWESIDGWSNQIARQLEAEKMGA